MALSGSSYRLVMDASPAANDVEVARDVNASSGDQPSISLRGLTKYYGRDRGVEDLTFEVMPGEVFGFLGPNGAGKTTALRMLVGLLGITRGSATILGTDVATAPASLRHRIGYLPGALALYGNLTGAEYLRFLARMRGRRMDRRIAELSERLNLDLTRHIHDLSKGNQQKIGVVQAFMHSPEILILDEPTAGLDPIVQREFEALIDEARQQGAAILLSSHVLSEVDHLAGRVAIVDGGHLVVVEDIATLKRRALRTIDLDFAQPVDAEPFTRLPGVTDVRSRGCQVTCTVTGAETDLFRHAAGLGVLSVRTHEPSLDQVFFALVRGGDRHADRPADEIVA
jgi:ABC-2 type transport system ATP-binding protein